MNKKPVLILAAHPDDEVLGCGGIIQLHRKEEREVYVCVVTDGSSSQYLNDPKIAKIKNDECENVKRFLGIKEVLHLNFPDMKLDTVPHIKLNQAIEDVFEKIKPGIVYTHYKHDLNNDHACINQSTMVVARPGKNCLEEVLEYEVLSSSEWMRDSLFAPNVFINIEDFVNTKIEAFEKYQTEIRNYPHPRSREGIEVLAQYRGLQAGYKYAEAFRVMIKYG